MFRRIVVTAMLAGLVAGLVLSTVQQLQVVPLILTAEGYETGTAASADSGRIAATALANVLSAIGFALLLVAAYAMRGGVDWRQGILWGLGGFAVFFVLPGLGLPPELPGTAHAGLAERQAWWLLAVLCSAAGLALVLLQRRLLWRVAGLGLLVLPHLLGAPHPEAAHGVVPESLADAFVMATAVANGVFWLLLGGLSGFLFWRLS